jgi:hypothetical protein
MNNKHQALAQALITEFGTQVSRVDLYNTAKKFGINHPVAFTKNKVGWGMYDISEFASGSNATTRVAPVAQVVENKAVEQTDKEVLESIRKNFVTLDRMVNGVAAGKVRSMIVSGPAGIGKTYSIESILESAQADEKIVCKHVSGYAKATGIFKILWNNRHENSVIVLDDIDSIFADETALNILKGALDSKKRRVISWNSQAEFVDKDGDIIPNEFEFKGSVIFITNCDFEKMIAKDRSNAPHYQALISRSFYIDVNLNTPREFLLRVQDVLMNTDMGFELGLNVDQQKIVIDFMKNNMNRIREISLRMAVKLSQILQFEDSLENFYSTAESTCLRRK